MVKSIWPGYNDEDILSLTVVTAGAVILSCSGHPGAGCSVMHFAHAVNLS
jgi:hypothetical protein